MNEQTIINALIGIVFAVGGWWCTKVWKELESSRERERMKAEKDAVRDAGIMTKLSTIELLVVGQYAKKEELSHMQTAIESKLTRIEDLELTMATDYVTKTDFNAIIQTLFGKLDRSDVKLDSLLERLDKKADK
jgi:uncharacterized coiled-coil protein SlyX